MKPVHLLFAVTVGLNLPAALGQASFDFRNYASWVGLDAPVYDWNGGLLAGSEWRFELYGGAAQSSLSPLVDLRGTGRAIIPLAAPGYFSANKELIVSGVPEGGWAWLQVRGFSLDCGATYEEAVASACGGYGASAPFLARGGAPSGLELPAQLLGLTSFSVLPPVPEPAIGWLLLAGLPVLWWRWRGRWKAEG